MRIRLSIPDHLVTPQALEAALEATSLANAEAIRRGEIPHAIEAIERGAKWRPEPFLDGEHFDLGHQVTERGWGDCDDLAPYLTGSLIASGEDEGARTRIQKTGPNRYHAVVETSDGRILDPSRWAGMGKRSAPSSAGVVGSIAKPFAHPEGGAIAVVPYRGQWWARCDLPWSDASAHIASHARSRDPNVALARAVEGAIDCGVQIESPLIERAICAGSFLLDGPEVGSLNAFQQLTLKPMMGKLAPDWQDPAKREQMLQYANTLGQHFDANTSLHDYAVWLITKAPSTTHDKGLDFIKGAVKQALPFAPMAANALMPGAGTALSMLTHGAGGVLPAPEGGQVVMSRNGAVSVPLESPDTSTPQHMFLYYHPKGNPGPVIMRF